MVNKRICFALLGTVLLLGPLIAPVSAIVLSGKGDGTISEPELSFAFTDLKVSVLTADDAASKYNHRLGLSTSKAVKSRLNPLI